MNRTYTVTTSVLHFTGGLPTNEQVGESCAKHIETVLEKVKKQRGIVQTPLGVGGVNVQTDQGQCLVLFVSTCD